MTQHMTVAEKLSIPGAIVIGCIVLAGAFYLVESHKEQAIEHQQEQDNARKDLAAKQAECEALAPGVKSKWNNVMGVTYDSEIWKDCVVTYTDAKTGEVQTSPLKFMTTIK